MSFDEKATRIAFGARLNSLDNDVQRAYWRIPGIQPSPFPATMYAFATLDHFSSCEAGWNDASSKNPFKKALGDKRTQTERMVDFCVTYAGLPRYESQVAVKLWRHVLMHLAQPHVITIGTDKCGWSVDNKDTKHWTIETIAPNRLRFRLGLFTFSEQLHLAVEGTGRYFDQLRGSPALQARYASFQAEVAALTL